MPFERVQIERKMYFLSEREKNDYSRITNKVLSLQQGAKRIIEKSYKSILLHWAYNLP
jgi:hypothetical protein